VPPLHNDRYSRAAGEYADSRSHKFEQSVAVQQARWPRLAIIAGVVLGLVGNVAVALTQVLPSSPKTAIMLGVVLVVLLGAGGLAIRGVGEMRNSPGWKASGCFLCAAAYLGTATVALVNGVPLIFQP
jgi:drug/metabolite transporter (DMT)-like permease